MVTAEKAEGDRKAEARAALAERLCRMTAPTLRGMLKANEVELRRGAAALACAMKDDKDHIVDLIGALEDKEGDAVRAAHAGLKSLTGKDFGPVSGASGAQVSAAVAAWRAWYAKEKTSKSTPNESPSRTVFQCGLARTSSLRRGACRLGCW